MKTRYVQRSVDTGALDTSRVWPLDCYSVTDRLLDARRGQKKYTMKGNDEKRNCSSAYTLFTAMGKNKMAVSWLQILYTMPCSRLLYTTVGFNLPRATDSACPRN